MLSFSDHCRIDALSVLPASFASQDATKILSLCPSIQVAIKVVFCHPVGVCSCILSCRHFLLFLLLSMFLFSPMKYMSWGIHMFLAMDLSRYSLTLLITRSVIIDLLIYHLLMWLRPVV